MDSLSEQFERCPDSLVSVIQEILTAEARPRYHRTTFESGHVQTRATTTPFLHEKCLELPRQVYDDLMAFCNHTINRPFRCQNVNPNTPDYLLAFDDYPTMQQFTSVSDSYTVVICLRNMSKAANSTS